MIYMLVGYMWLFIYRPFEIWPLLGVLHLERIYMICLLIMWLLLKEKKWTSNRINSAIGVFVISVVLSTLFSDCATINSSLIVDWFKILVFYLLLMTSIDNEKDFRIIIVSFVLIMGFFELHSVWEFYCGRGVSRMGIWRMVAINTTLGDPNSFAASVNLGIPLLLPVFAITNKKIQKFGILLLFLLAVVCIGLTGSRGGMAGLGLLLAGAVICYKHRIFIISIACILVPLGWFVLLSEKLQNRYLTLIDPSKGPANAQASADSRLEFFKMAVDIWEKNLLLGVGPGCFGVSSGTGMQPHSLYAQTISDLGMAGIISLIMISYCYSRNYFDGRQFYLKFSDSSKSKFSFLVLVATIIGLFQLLFLGLAGHNLYRYAWIWYGSFSALALKFIKQNTFDDN